MEIVILLLIVIIILQIITIVGQKRNNEFLVENEKSQMSEDIQKELESKINKLTEGYN